MAWSDENVETLKRLWAQGVPGKEIAKQIPGCTGASAVIGKAHRLGLPGRGNPVTKGPDFSAIFERVADLVIEPPYLSIQEAARRVGFSPDVARRMWVMRIEATHGGEPA